MTSSEPSEFRALDALAVLVTGILILFALASVLPAKALVFANVALPLGVIVGAGWRKRKSAPLFSPGPFRIHQVLWTVVGTAGIYFVLPFLTQPLFKLFPHDYTPELEELGKEILDFPPASRWLLLVVLAPFCEESFFRGALLRGFRNSWGAFAGVAGSSALFAVFHVMPPRIVVTFLLGLWFGALALRTGGLAMPFLAHAINNGLVLLLFTRFPKGVPMWMAAPGAAAALFACWMLFRSRAGSMQGLSPPGPS